MTLDIAGQRFGKLVAKRPEPVRFKGAVVWDCACDCGRQAAVSVFHLRRGKIQSCGCAQPFPALVFDPPKPPRPLHPSIRDITGEKFGLLTAIKPTAKRLHNAVVWKFRCDCGRITHHARVPTAQGVRHCGCANRGLANQFAIDLTGSRYGRLKVISFEDSPEGVQGLRWRCECACGNFTVARAKDLRAGTTTSCGCGRGAALKHVTGWRCATIETGDRFGKLTVQGQACIENGSRHYLCRCDCGGQTIVRSGLLRTGQTKSCGCLRGRPAAAKVKARREREFETAGNIAADLRQPLELRLALSGQVGLVHSEAA